MPYWKLFYHFIWGTKDRQPLLLSEFEPQLHRVVAAKVIEMGGTVHAIGGTDDHMHIATSVPPKLAISRFIGEVKGSSSHFVNHVVKPDFAFCSKRNTVCSVCAKGTFRRWSGTYIARGATIVKGPPSLCMSKSSPQGFVS